MPTAFPIEFRRDVAAVARRGDGSIAPVVKDFGVSESCLQPAGLQPTRSVQPSWYARPRHVVTGPIHGRQARTTNIVVCGQDERR